MANIKDYADLGEAIQDADKLPGTNDSDQSIAYNFSFTRILDWFKTKTYIQEILDVTGPTYSVTTDGSIMNVSYTDTGSVTITIETALINADFKNVLIKDAGGLAGTNNITIVGEGGELIDGNTDLIISGNYSAVQLYSYNGEMFIY